MRIVKTKVFGIASSSIEESNFIKDIYKGSRTTSWCFPNARLVYVDGIFNFFLSRYSFYSDILIELLECKVFKVGIFLSSHYGCGKDFLPSESFFQKLKSDITLNKFLSIIEKSEECGIH